MLIRTWRFRQRLGFWCRAPSSSVPVTICDRSSSRHHGISARRGRVARLGIPKETFRHIIKRIEPFSVSEGYRAFYRAYAERFGKPRWGDKTPMSCLHLDTIESVLPEAHFIHLIRDGRDVALSWRQTWFSPGNAMEVLAEEWARCVSTARAQGAHCQHYLEVRFEDLIRNPVTVLIKICGFLQLPYTAQMLEYHVGVPGRLTEHRARVAANGEILVSQATRLKQQVLTMQPPQRSRIQALEAHNGSRRAGALRATGRRPAERARLRGLVRRRCAAISILFTNNTLRAGRVGALGSRCLPHAHRPRPSSGGVQPRPR